MDTPPVPNQSSGLGEDPLISPVTNAPSVLVADQSNTFTRRLRANNTDGGLIVHVANNPESSGTPVNVFSEVDAPFATETTILTYTVPGSQTFDITSVIAWGDFDGEFLIRVDGILRGGGRNSAAERTLSLPYESAPILATAGQVVTVTITHYSPSMQHFRANLLGGLN